METDKKSIIEVKKDWLDILFQYRNKAYGAYILRKEYVMTLTKSQLITLAVLLLVFVGSYAGKLFKKVAEETKVKKNVDVVMQPPPPLEDEPEPPPPPKLPEQIKVEKFTPPEIVEDNEVRKEDEVKPPDEIKGNVGTIEQEGTTDVIVPVDAGPAAPIEDDKVYSQKDIKDYEIYSGLNDFLEKNLEYPEYEKDAEITGVVKIGFTIEKDGSISNVHVAKSVSQGLDEEAVRVVKMMPKWKPATFNGRAVKLTFVLPITFSL
ncbi:MAG: TonB family protein [Bacteroidetes bacterium]|nr:TonB family protein [Bacteroidota bacterium]